MLECPHGAHVTGAVHGSCLSLPMQKECVQSVKRYLHGRVTPRLLAELSLHHNLPGHAAAGVAARYGGLGAVDVGVAYMADVSHEGLCDSGGALAVLTWRPESARGSDSGKQRVATPEFERPKCGVMG